MTKRKPRIAILHYSSPPVIGGVEFIIDAHARLFAEAGYKTELVVGRGESTHPGVPVTVIPELSADGGSLHKVIDALHHGRVPEELPDAVKQVERSLIDALRGVDVCMVHNVLTMHFNLVFTTALVNVIKRRPHIRFISWTHDSTFVDPNYADHQRRKDYPWKLLARPVRGCDYCVISNQRRSEISKVFGIPASRLAVIPDGMDVRQLLGLTRLVADLFVEEELYRQEIVALTPTRIVRRKKLETGLEIVAALKKMGKSVRWIITGAPDPYNEDAVQYFEELVALRRRLRLGNSVIFLCERWKQWVSNDDLRGLYGVSNMLLFPSEREGFGIPVLEAAITGLLVVVSDIPALRELGGKDTVYIYPKDSAETVACRILRGFNRSPRLVFRKKIIATYSWDAVFNEKILPAVVKPQSVWKKRK